MRQLHSTISIISICLLSLLLSSPSCRKRDDSKNKPAVERFRLSREDALKIVEKNYLRRPDTLLVDTLHNSKYLAAIVHKKLCVMHYFADTWQELHSEDIDFPSSVHAMEWIDLDSMPYFYYTTESYGNAFGSVDFNLYSLTESKSFNIMFSGEVFHYDKMVPISDTLRMRAHLLAFLEHKIASSDLVYRPQKDEYELEKVSNAVDKWKFDNPDIYTALKQNAVEPTPVIFTAYKEDLRTKLSLGSQVAEKENSWFKAISFFKSEVICIDKKTLRYFILWVPESQYEWITEIAFEKADVVLLKDTDDRTLRVDLAKKTILKVRLDGSVQ